MGLEAVPNGGGIVARASGTGARSTIFSRLSPPTERRATAARGVGARAGVGRRVKRRLVELIPCTIFRIARSGKTRTSRVASCLHAKWLHRRPEPRRGLKSGIPGVRARTTLMTAPSISATHRTVVSERTARIAAVASVPKWCPPPVRVKVIEEQMLALRTAVICAFNQLLDLKDLNTGVHSTRLAEWALHVAGELGMNESELAGMEVAALL